MKNYSKWSPAIRGWCLFLPFPFMSALGFAGLCPVVLFKPGKLNEALAQHELVHCRQCVRGFWVWWWLQYIFSKRKRFEFELEGYRASVKYGRPLGSCARALWSNYGKQIGLKLSTVELMLQ